MATVEETGSATALTSALQRAPGWALWFALAVCWFATVPFRPLLDPDEARYAEIPREMAASGDWLTPRLDGLKYFEKPPLQYWATAAVYSAFGVREWTARLWAVGLAFLCLPMVFAWTRLLYGLRAGLAALAALAATPYFVVLGHLNLLDAAFTFWLTGAVFAFALAQSADNPSAERRWMILAWVAAALAVLSKGIVVIVLAGLALVVYSLLERDGRPWRRLQVPLGLPLFALIAVPWFVAVSNRNPEFPAFFFVHEHFARFLTTVHQREGAWWYFLPYLLFAVLPWARAILGAVRAAWSNPGIAGRFKPQKFLLIYAGVTLVFFSISGSKLPPYILPMMPALAALVGIQVAQRPAFMREIGWFFLGMMLIGAVGLVSFSIVRNGQAPALLMGWAAAAATVGLLMIWLLWGREAIVRTRPILLICAASVLGWDCLLAAYTATPPVRTGVAVAKAAQALIHPRTDLYSVGEYRHSLTFYLRRPLVLVGYLGELEFGVQQEPGRQSASPEEFMTRWRASTDAVAFFAPEIFNAYRLKGLPGQVVAADTRTVVVRR